MSRDRPTARRSVLGVLVVALLCLLTIVGSAGPASAHASLVSTDPVDGAVLEASPGQATLRFTEPVSLPPEGVRVFDAQGGAIESSATSSDLRVQVDLPDQLGPGSYVVVWRIVSADGHPVAGSLSFAVGRPSVVVAVPAQPVGPDRAVTTALAVAQALMYLGLLLAVGLAVFATFLLPPGTSAALHTKGPSRAPAPGVSPAIVCNWVEEGPLRRLQFVATSAAGVSALAALAVLPITVVDQRGSSLSEAFTPGVWSGTAPSELVSIALLIAGLTLIVLSLQTARARRWSATAGVGLAVIAPALTGHTRAFEPLALVMASDIVHVLAGSIWFGGLVGLALTLPSISHLGPVAAQTLARFSTAAASVLIALSITGSLLAWRILGSWDALLHTTYGVLLLVKVGVVALVAIMAAYNRFVLLPRHRDEGESRVAQRVSRVVSVEAAMLVVAIGVTGFLVHQSPVIAAPVVPAGRTDVATTSLGEDYKVLATMSPGRVGRNTVRVQLQDLAGEPFEPPNAPQIRVLSDGLDLGAVSMSPEAAGTFRGEVVVPTPGTWRVQVGVRTGELDSPTAVVELPVVS